MFEIHELGEINSGKETTVRRFKTLDEVKSKEARWFLEESKKTGESLACGTTVYYYNRELKK